MNVNVHTKISFETVICTVDLLGLVRLVSLPGNLLLSFVLSDYLQHKYSHQGQLIAPALLSLMNPAYLLLHGVLCIRDLHIM